MNRILNRYTRDFRSSLFDKLYNIKVTNQTSYHVEILLYGMLLENVTFELRDSIYDIMEIINNKKINNT